VNKTHISLGTGCLIFALSIAICTKTTPVKAQPDAAPALSAQAAGSSAVSDSPDAKSFSGKVVETMNAANYTYILVDTGKQKLWAAARQFQVKVGDSVTIEAGMPMRNYHSPTLNRDFELVYFTGNALVGGVQATTANPAATLPPGHPPTTGGPAQPTKIDLSGIKKAEGGKTIQEIYAAKAQLAGKPVKVRGKVVKYNSMIMGKNWLHLQDGTGTEGSNDLTLTTTSEAKVGNTVVVTGTIAIDKDFGYGYKYPVIMEDAKLVVE
jgi:hypothetical protein